MYERRYTNYRQPKKKRRILPFVVAIFIVLGGVWALYKIMAKQDTATHNKPAEKTAKKEPEIDTASMDARIKELVAANTNISAGVVVTDLDTNKTWRYGEESAYVAASVNKLVTVLAYLHKVEAGEASLDDYVGGLPAGAQIQKAIVNSDNVAWESFYRGTPCTQHNAYAQSIGLTSYDCKANTISAPDVAALLAQLYKGELLNKSHTDLLLSYMKEANYQEYIVAAVPANATAYHKAGYLNDRAHDAAVITNGKHAYALVIFTKSVAATYDSVTGTEFIHNITKATTDTFLR